MAHEDGIERFLAWRQVRDLTGLGRTTAWRLRQAGDFPEPVPISPGRVAWRARDIARWNESRGDALLAPDRLTPSVRSPPSLPLEHRVMPSAPSRPGPALSPTGRSSTPRRRRRSNAGVAEGQLGFDF